MPDAGSASAGPAPATAPAAPPATAPATATAAMYLERLRALTSRPGTDAPVPAAAPVDVAAVLREKAAELAAVEVPALAAVSHSQKTAIPSPVLQRKDNRPAAPAASLDALKARLAKMQKKSAA